MDRQRFLMWTSRFLSVSIRQWDVPPQLLYLFASLSSFPLLFTCLLVVLWPLSLIKPPQVNWQWLWARWVVENHLCCWQRWERCSECRGPSPGTGQLQVHCFLSVPVNSDCDWVSCCLISLRDRWILSVKVLIRFKSHNGTKTKSTV